MRVRVLALWGLFLLVLSGCQKDVASRIEAKWQLREVIGEQGGSVRVDSVFYNFQKGTFTAIRLRSSGVYKTFYGSYDLDDADNVVISLHLKEGEFEELPADIGWDSELKRFHIESVNASDMELKSDGATYLFRKY